MDKLVVLLRRISLRNRMFYVWVLLSVIPVTLMILTSYIVENINYVHNLRQNNHNFAYESSVRVNDLFEQLEANFDYLTENNDILADLYLYENNPDYPVDYLTRRLNLAIGNIVSTQAEISFSGVFLNDGTTFSFNRTPYKITDLDSLKKQQNEWYMIEKDGISYLGKIQDVEVDYIDKQMVTFIVLIDIQNLNGVLDLAKGKDDQDIRLVNGDGFIIANTRDFSEKVSEHFTLSDRTLRDKDTYDITHSVRGTNLYVVSTFESHRLPLTGMVSTIALIVLSFMLAGIIILMNYESLRLPLERLLERIKRAGHGEELMPHQEIYEDYNDEHVILNAEFSSMLIRLDSLLKETYATRIHDTRIRTRIKELELISLQQRINPHFFYNILDNLFWMSQMKGYDEIGEMISTLGAFFKTSVSEKGAYVSIALEIENVKSYLSLQKIMHKDLFEVVWDVEEDILFYKTVKLILQPIIENSIVHGFEEIREGGIIRVWGRQLEETIVFRIEDNGKGMSQEACERMLLKMNSASLDVGDSIGMRNVNQRIKIHYGDAYGVGIESEINQGTSVTIIIPKRSNLCTV